MTQKESELKVTLRTVCFRISANFSADYVDPFFHDDEHSTRCEGMRTMRDQRHTHTHSLSLFLISSRIARGAQAPGTCICIMWVAMTHDEQDQHTECSSGLNGKSDGSESSVWLASGREKQERREIDRNLLTRQNKLI